MGKQVRAYAYTYIDTYTKTALSIYVDVCMYVHMSVQTTCAYMQRRSVDKENGVRILVPPFDPPSSMLSWHETKGGMNNGHMDHPTQKQEEQH